MVAQDGIEVGVAGVGLDAADEVGSDFEFLALFVIEAVAVAVAALEGKIAKFFAHEV